MAGEYQEFLKRKNVRNSELTPQQQTSYAKEFNTSYGVSPEIHKVGKAKGYSQAQIDNLEFADTDGWGTNGYDVSESFNTGTGGGLALTMGANGQYNTGFWSPEQWQKFGESGGTIGDYGEVNLGTGSTGPGMSAVDVATLVNAGTGTANAFLGYKNYGLAKDTFNFNKAAVNRDIANQGLAYNTELDRRAGIDARLRGGTDEIRKQVADEYAAKKMNTSAIG